ncbi:MAG: DNA repair protein RecO, partial [Myxococcota bacterium]
MNTEIEGIVVGSLDLGESDRLIRLLTADEGRSVVVARGSRSSRRRFAGMLELGVRIAIVRSRSRGGLPVLVEADWLSGPERARDDLDRLGFVAYGCELCGALAPEGDAAPKLYGLLATWLLVLEGDVTPGDAARVALEGKALTFAGLAPALVRCARCDEPLH